MCHIKAIKGTTTASTAATVECVYEQKTARRDDQIEAEQERKSFVSEPAFKWTLINYMCMRNFRVVQGKGWEETKNFES